VCAGCTSDVVSGEVFNGGQDSDNCQVQEIAEIVAQEYPGCQLPFGALAATAGYRTSFEKY
jgi:hypothetical protein